MCAAPMAQKAAQFRRGRARPRAAFVQIKQACCGFVGQPGQGNIGERETHRRKR